MNFLILYIISPIIWLISKIPMRILYVISDFFYVLIYYVFKYRKEVVFQNLSYAFPEKSEKELQIVGKKFYKHFADIIFESLKSFSISEKEILKRYTYKNPELVNKYAKEGRSIALVSAHLANWEWSFSLPLVLDLKIFGAYSKLRNETFEDFLKKNREKFGVVGMRTTDAMEKMVYNFKNKIQGAYILLSDQSPKIEKTFYWSDFFGIRVPVHTGAEMIAKKFDLVVINYSAKKIKRGYYEIEFELITDAPTTYENYQITDKYLKITEATIREQPECYLWSHKRFKHKDKVPEKYLK